LVLGKVAAGTFEARVRQLIAGNPLLVEVMEALLKPNFRILCAAGGGKARKSWFFGARFGGVVLK
jgi:hypothetical protein